MKYYKDGDFGWFILSSSALVHRKPEKPQWIFIGYGQRMYL